MKHRIGAIVSGINICRDWHGRGIDVSELQKLLTLEPLSKVLNHRVH
ncbi:MAG TPA: hypothetical protein VFF47_00690 [Nitrospirota bacterium]|nr:hypothetical protein [Nitrospirota bacterium]